MQAFLFHILIASLIFALLASGFKTFLKLKGDLDFSYMAIVLFASYASTLLSLKLWLGWIPAMMVSFLMSFPFTLLILYLSNKLDGVYFTLGTLTIYIFFYQFAYNAEWLTGGALGLNNMSSILLGSRKLVGLEQTLLFVAGVAMVIFLLLMLLRKSYFYKLLIAWGEREQVLKALGIATSPYKFALILLTSFLATVGGGLYAMYYHYIDPSSFWLGMLMLVLIIVFLSYKWEEWGTAVVGMLVLFGYEYLRFAKLVPADKLGYFREIIFSFLVLVLAFVLFKKIKVKREI